MNRTEVQQEWFGGLGLLTHLYGTITECSVQTCTEAKEWKVVVTSSSQKTHTHLAAIRASRCGWAIPPASQQQ